MADSTWTTILTEAKNALSAVLKNQSYNIDGVSYTRADADKIRSIIRDAEEHIARESFTAKPFASEAFFPQD